MTYTFIGKKFQEHVSFTAHPMDQHLYDKCLFLNGLFIDALSTYGRFLFHHDITVTNSTFL